LAIDAHHVHHLQPPAHVDCPRRARALHPPDPFGLDGLIIARVFILGAHLTGDDILLPRLIFQQRPPALLEIAEMFVP
jgi:hypothetical protein